jgi:imidazolonepropionase
MSELHIIPRGAVLTRGEKILAVGTEKQLLKMPDAKRAREVDARGGVVMPGFVDSHSHPVFAATRVEEFEMRLRGSSYERIAAAGGGILNSAKRLRATPEKTLLENLQRWSAEFLRHGTTTLEAKSGYGLDVDSELKMLRVIRRANVCESKLHLRREADAVAITNRSHVVLELVPTFLGAHAIPEEYRKNRQHYVRLVIEEMIPRVASNRSCRQKDGESASSRRGLRLAEFCDVFCENIAFTVEESRRILLAAQRAGLKLKIHADQLTRNGGALLAAELGAASADHLECATRADARALKKAGVIATLLPAVNFFLGHSKHAPARTFIEEGVPVALATDFNPGTCPCLNMQTVLAIACSQLRMTPAEAISATTINGAHAICRGDRIGSLEADKQADLILLDVRDYREIPYFFGVNHCRTVIKKGKML